MSYEIKDTISISFDRIKCSSCGVNFMMEHEHCQQRREDGESFYCPNGHSLSWNDNCKTRLDKAAAEISRLASQVQLERDQKAATEASLQRLKFRISKGVCPCCKRTVRQLARHMEAKHPTYQPCTT